MTARAGSAKADGQFVFDPTHRTLEYAVQVAGTPAARVYSVSIDRDSAGKKGPVLRVLSGAGMSKIKNTIKLTDVERRDLVAGRTSLVVYTADQPRGTLRAPLRLTP